MRVTIAALFAAAAALVATPAGAATEGADAPREAQARAPARNAVHAELGGPGLLYTVSYERFLVPRFSVRAGVSLFGFREGGTGDTLGVFTLPITVQYLVGGGSHHLELGFGVITGALWSDLNGPRATSAFGLAAATGTVGYRYQPPAGGLILRVAFTPFYGGERFAPAGLPVMPWGSVGAGYAF